MYKYRQRQSHIGKQSTVNLILFKTKLPTENSMLWQNPNREGVSSCLNWTKISIYSLVKAKKYIKSKERLLFSYGKHKAVQKRFRFSNLPQKLF